MRRSLVMKSPTISPVRLIPKAGVSIEPGGSMVTKAPLLLWAKRKWRQEGRADQGHGEARKSKVHRVFISFLLRIRVLSFQSCVYSSFSVGIRSTQGPRAEKQQSIGSFHKMNASGLDPRCCARSCALTRLLLRRDHLDHLEACRTPARPRPGGVLRSRSVHFDGSHSPLPHERPLFSFQQSCPGLLPSPLTPRPPYNRRDPRARCLIVGAVSSRGGE